MDASQVEALIKEQHPELDLLVETDGYYYQVRAVGEAFDGLNAVKRQQLIYACLNAQIVDGTIHAVIIKAYTPEEWAQQNS